MQRDFSARVIPFTLDPDIKLSITQTYKYRDWTAFGGGCSKGVLDEKETIIRCASRELHEESRGCFSRDESIMIIGDTISHHPNRVISYKNVGTDELEYLIFVQINPSKFSELLHCFRTTDLSRLSKEYKETKNIGSFDFMGFMELLINGVYLKQYRTMNPNTYLDPTITYGLISYFKQKSPITRYHIGYSIKSRILHVLSKHESPRDFPHISKECIDFTDSMYDMLLS